jgi:hypothetical protein
MIRADVAIGCIPLYARADFAARFFARFRKHLRFAEYSALTLQVLVLEVRSKEQQAAYEKFLHFYVTRDMARPATPGELQGLTAFAYQEAPLIGQHELAGRKAVGA